MYMQKGLVKLSISMLLLVFLSSLTYASDAEDFLILGAGAKPLSLGQAYVAKKGDVNMIYWNPAGLVNIKEKQVTTTSAELGDFDMSINSVGYVTPYRAGVAGVNLTHLNISDMVSSSTTLRVNPVTGKIEPRPNITGAFKMQNTALTLSYGQNLKDKISVGGSLKLVQQKIQGTDSGYGIDIAGIYKKSENLTLGVNLQNIISKIGPDKFPTNLKIGLSYDVTKLGKKEIKGLTVGADCNTKYSTLHIGSEYHFSELSALRMGLNDGEFTVGVGVKFGNYSLDYAYFGDDLGDTHRVSLGSILGK